MSSDPTKGTDDVSGAARALDAEPLDESDDGGEAPPSLDEDMTLDPDALAEPPARIAELAAACVRFVAARYGTQLDFAPDTLSLLDQWLRDARADLRDRPEAAEVIEGSAGAYLGEVVRRYFGAQWSAEGAFSAWRLCLSTVYCAFNPVGMAREALLLAPAEGWGADFTLDPGESEALEARVAALPSATEDEFYAPSTRFDVLSIVFAALRESLRVRGLADVRFSAPDYD